MHCVIFGAMPVNEECFLNCKKADYIIAADAGYKTAKSVGAMPNYFLGDYDSASVPKDVVCEILPKEKDDTDTHYAAKHALKLGASEVTILGGIGGRLDHTIANMQTLAFLSENGVKASMISEENEVHALTKGTYEISAIKGYVSLFSASDMVKGLNLKGFKYNVENATIKNNYPIGVSNEFVAEKATISFESGVLYLLFCKE